MTSEQFVAAGHKLFGTKRWKSQMARMLGIHVVTVYRLAGIAPDAVKQIPGPVEVAVKGLLQHKRAQDILDREARKLLPAVRKKIKFRKNVHKPRSTRNPAAAISDTAGIDAANDQETLK
jgi:hypothetical protein